ncbi:hypothetical protein ETB97_005214 [Aspergillus alliaceus]|uniref:Uncharacterized protein n=1 Tax=Petromyces alliaceus TaxID=209559 RepID=A0A8H6A0V7_PETAA|nr:hypothetical protein ETB97_005214 [Aspergillus burnettii]
MLPLDSFSHLLACYAEHRWLIELEDVSDTSTDMPDVFSDATYDYFDGASEPAYGRQTTFCSNGDMTPPNTSPAFRFWEDGSTGAIQFTVQGFSEDKDTTIKMAWLG